MTLIKISFRNIIKNGRRSLITILAIAFGFAAINLFQGYVHNTYRGLRAAAIHGEGLGHLTVFKKDYLTKGKLFPERYSFKKSEVENAIALIKTMEGVETVTPRMSVSGIISNGKNSTIFIAEGLVSRDDVKIRGDISRYPNFEGEYLDDGDRSGVVMGSELARMLNLKKGDTAVILSNTMSGMANALDADVRGIFNTGVSATNDKLLLLNYKHAQDLIDFQGAERLVVLLNDDEQNVDEFAGRLERSFNSRGIEVEIKTWYDLSVFYKQVRSMFDMIFLFIFTIVLVIIVMSVINTMTMSIIERTREIGTMRALGFKRRSVKFLISTEGLLLGLLGSGGGALIFFSLYLFIASVHPTYIPPGNSTPVPLQVDLVPSALVRNMLFLVLLSLAAAFIPAKKSSNMNIVDALGHI